MQTIRGGVDYRRILLDGYPTDVVLDGELLVARDGRRVAVEEAIHLQDPSDVDNQCTAAEASSI